jgi:cyanophycin synthetase
MFEHFHFNVRLFIQELQKRDIKCRLIPKTNIIEAVYGDHCEFITPEYNRIIPSIYSQLINDKFYMKQLLGDYGYPVAKGKLFLKNAQTSALWYAQEELGYPVVIKPTNLMHGNHVYLNINSSDEFNKIWSECIEPSGLGALIVEEYLPNTDDYRILVFENGTKATLKRTPPVVTGDGNSTIQELIIKENHRRMNPRNTCLCEIYIGDVEGKRALLEKGHKDTDILPKNEKLVLRYNSNISYGGECENISEVVHPSYYKLAENILKHFPSLPFISVDLVAHDVTKDCAEDLHAIIECHTTVGYSMFSMPSKGPSFYILEPIIDLLFPETATKNT